jgi:hypothetical protein
MSSMKRIRLAVLFLITAALLAATRADAGPWIPTKKASGTARLTPPATSDEPTASGQAKFTGRWVRNYFGALEVFGNLTVTCGGLTPGATYHTSAGSFTASPTGDGTATGIYGGYPSLRISVAREEVQADGSVVLIVVLEGTLKIR